jgi:hypothetical protein
VLQSNGTDVVWGTALGGPPSGAAGGDLTGTYPNPTIKPAALLVASGWTDDGTTTVHTTTATRTVGIGTSAPTTGAMLHARSTTGTVNGMTALAVEQTTPGTNQEVGLLMTNQGQTCFLGTGAGTSGTSPVNVTFHQNNANGQIWYQLAGCKNDGLDNINMQFSEFLTASGWFSSARWLLHAAGRDDAVTAGASTTGDQVVRTVNWAWPTIAANDSRYYKFLVSGKITRAAGNLHLKLLWGRATGTPLIFDWATTAATWANAYFWIDVDVNMYIQAGAYSTRMYLVTDPAAFPAAAIATPYITNGTYASLAGSGGGAFTVTCNFDTSNAGNSVTINQEYLFMTKGR